MAAKPPKPPRNFLKNLFLNSHISNNSDNNNDNDDDNNRDINDTPDEILNSNTENLNDNSTVNGKRSNCNCTNITIMHLFHEMKQEFPTIPDTVVTQCVNENCHQRENCIQMLRNELALNPIPVQSYPAKVLHPSINHNNNSNLNNSNGNNNNGINNNINIGNKNNNNNINIKKNYIQNIKKSTSPPLSSAVGAGGGQKPPLQQKPPLKPPLKPVRPAPLHPPIASAKLPNRIPCGEISSSNLSADGLNLEGRTINEACNDMPTATNTLQIPLQQQQQQQQQQFQRPNSLNSIHINGEVVNYLNNTNSVVESKNCETTTTTSSPDTNEVSSRPVKPVRPTTLNLNLQQQQQQKQQRLNVQLQEQLQQQQRSKQTTTSATGKPLRKAPLPPIGPKPIIFHHSTNTNQNHSHSHHHHHVAGTDVSPQSESEISINLTLSTPSPTTSSPSSTKSLTTTTSKTHHTTQQKQNLQNNKSPIRHRSVITLQPEPPYTRDFLQSGQQTSTTTPTHQQQSQQQQNSNSSIQTPTCIVSSPTNSVHSGQSQKSYTSVNLTLRPPTTVLNSALQPSAIDITAGPGFSGASGGGKSLSYSSTSYDARLGYQQNFHITVTDEGGVFSASRRRSQQQRNINQVNMCKNQYKNNNNDDDDQNDDNDDKYNRGYVENNNNNCSLYNEQQQQKYQQQQQYYQADKVHPYPQQQQQYNSNHNSPSGIGCSSGFGSMCLAPQQAEDDLVTETLERQKKRRDRLAGALRENKKRLSQEEKEVNLITGPIPEGLSERLDIEIQRLRAECDAMLRSSNPLTQQQPPPPQKQQQPYQQFSPQPFPRQRSVRPPPRPPPNGATTMPPRQSSLDIIQHHNTHTPCSPHTPASLPNYTPHSPTMGQQWSQHSPHHSSLPPSIYQQHHQQQQHHPYTEMPDDEPPSYNIDQDVPDYDVDDVENVVGDVGDHDDDDDEYEVVDHWECSMCTFRNHPQLNICECCDNVRIIPGTLTKFSRALKTTVSASASATALGLATPSPSSSITAAVAGLATVTHNAPLVTDVNAAGATASAADVSTRETDNNSTSASSAAANMAPQQLQHFALHI